MIKKTNSFYDLKAKIAREVKIARELSVLSNELEKTGDKEEKKLINSQLKILEKELMRTNSELRPVLNKILQNSSFLKIPFQSHKKIQEKTQMLPQLKIKPQTEKIMELSETEKQTIGRLRKKREPKKIRKRIEASRYVRISNKLFSRFSENLIKKGYFKSLKTNLLKANMKFLTKSYVSVIFFTTFLSFIASLILFVFLLFYNFSINFPFIMQFRGGIIERVAKSIWIVFVIPLLTGVLTYLYPIIEKKSIESRISQELPFASIHMAAVSESLIEPSNIFRIIIRTKEYPVLEKEFTKILNEINIFGKDLVTALRNSAFNSPSRKLAELLDGLATTITTGGSLPDFFNKRAQSLLFDYKIEKEKRTKTAETFMDIYISVVIAAPMILMLLLIMMRVSGLGIPLSTGMISLIMVLGVSFVNIIFLIFLQLKSSI